MGLLYLEETIILVLILTLFPLAAASLTGFLIVLAQSATQLQEQTITFLVKAGTLAAVIACAGPWAAQQVIDFMHRIFSSIAYVGAL